MKVSIIIRTLNEKDSLIQLLDTLEKQDFSDEKEIIIVDNESTDGTPQLVKERGLRLVTIPRNEFTFPYSMNKGCEAATGDILILLVGHALPISNNWLYSGLRHFQDKTVAGVYSPVIPKEKSSLVEKLYYWPGYLLAKIRGPHSIKKVSTGVFGGTNISLRKSLWEKHHFDETYELGGEDGEWARWALNQKYKIICDHNFAIRHSHNLNLYGLIKQIRYWNKLKKNTTFNKKELKFRKDIKF